MIIKFLLALNFISSTVICQNSLARLKQYNVNKDRVTLSGFSSGGSFAQQLQFSYSSLFHGIAVFSHTYYRCGGSVSGSIDRYDQLCTKLFMNTTGNTRLYNPELVHEDIKTYHRQNLIEDPSNLKNKILFVYAGLRNFLFSVDQSMQILNVYERYIQNTKAIKTRVQDSVLVMPTNNNFGSSCTNRADGTAFIGNCGFSGSGSYDALSFLLDDKNYQLIEPKSYRRIRLQRIQAFDQSEFYQGINGKHYMDTIGYIYIPQNCQSSKYRCYLHFYFHGCLVGREFNGTSHTVNSGFLEVAELNDIIVVFPQILSTRNEQSPLREQNEIGCWDTFGVTGENHGNRRGLQVIAVKNMLDKILGQGSSSQQKQPSRYG